MTRRRKPTTIYRSLFRDAARVAGERKALWVFGLFAALLSTGGVCEMAARGFGRLASARDLYASLMRGTFTGAQAFGVLVRDAAEFGTARVTFAGTALVLFLIAGAIASVTSQGALVAGVGPNRLTDAQAAQAGRRAFWHLLALNFLHKGAHLLVMALSALPLFLLVARPDGITASAAFLSFVVAFPLAVVISVVFMLASVRVVRTADHALDAIHHALVQFRAHWIAAFETGLVLFAVVVAAAVLFATAVALASIPFAVLATLTIIVGNPFLFVIVNAVGAAALVLLTFAFAGAVTTFQYAIWVGFYDHASVKNRIISKVRRIWHGR